MNSSRLRAYLMLLGVATIWGVASPIIKFTLEAFDPVTFLTYRYFISVIIAVVIYFFVKVKIPKNLGTIFLLVTYSFLNSVVSLGMLFFGMDNTTVLDMSLITLVGPLIVSIAGIYYLGEKITKREKLGMGIAMLGTVITIIEPMFFNGNNFIEFSGNLLIFGYVVNTAITAVMAKILLRQGVGPLTLVNSSFFTGFIFFFGFVLYSGNFTDNWKLIINTSPAFHIGVIYMAAISGTLGFWLSNKAQKTIEISEQSLFSYLSPIFAMPLAVLWLGEKITPIFIIGAIIIAFGVALAEIKRTRYNKGS